MTRKTTKTTKNNIKTKNIKTKPKPNGEKVVTTKLVERPKTKVIRIVSQRSHKMNRSRRNKRPDMMPVLKQITSGQKARVYAKNPAQRIALALALPSNSRNIRWGSMFNSRPTALSSPFTGESVKWLNGVTLPSNAYFPDNIQMAAVFRRPIASLIDYDPNPTSAHHYYKFWGNSGARSGQPPADSGWSPELEVLGSATPLYLHLPFAYPMQEYSPHGPVFYAGTVKECPEGRFYWMDKDDIVTMTADITAGTLFVVELVMWTPRGCDPVAANGLTVGAPCDVTVPAPGYYALRVKQITDPIVPIDLFEVISIELHAAGPTFGHKSLPNFEENFSSCNGIRVNAATLMYSSTAAENFVAGDIVTNQVPDGYHWMTVIEEPDLYQKALTMPGYDKRKSGNGAYTFLKPTDVSDFNVQNVYMQRDGVMYDSYWQIDDPSSYLLMVVNIPNTAGYQVGRWTASWGLEYSTEDVWRDLGVAPYHYEVYNKAFEVIQKLPSTFDNPVHVAEIWNSIVSGVGKALNFVSTYGPKAVEFADTVAPLLA